MAAALFALRLADDLALIMAYECQAIASCKRAWWACRPDALRPSGAYAGQGSGAGATPCHAHCVLLQCCRLQQVGCKALNNMTHSDSKGNSFVFVTALRERGL